VNSLLDLDERERQYGSTLAVLERRLLEPLTITSALQALFAQPRTAFLIVVATAMGTRASWPAGFPRLKARGYPLKAAGVQTPGALRHSRKLSEPNRPPRAFAHHPLAWPR
jgi:hypothetical protein